MFLIYWHRQQALLQFFQLLQKPQKSEGIDRARKQIVCILRIHFGIVALIFSITIQTFLGFFYFSNRLAMDRLFIEVLFKNHLLVFIFGI